MTENRFPITLKWLSAAEGGRNRPHTGPSYRTIAARNGDGPHGAFSVFCEFQSNDGITATGWLSLLVPQNFPDVLAALNDGEELTLFEGARPTAKAIIHLPIPAVA